MSEQNIWPGSASFSSGDTPFGIYNYDSAANELIFTLQDLSINYEDDIYIIGKFIKI